MYHTIYHTFEWDEDKWDVGITFGVDSYHPEYHGDFYEPPHGAEYEFTIMAIFHDLPDNSVPEPMYEGLREVVEAWFESDEGQYAAEEKADDDRFEEESYFDD